MYGAFEYGCCIYPVNPLLCSEYLGSAFDFMLSEKAKTCFSCVEFEFPIEQSFRLVNGRPNFQHPDKLDYPSQKLTKFFHDAGMFYWFEVNEFLMTRTLISNNSVCFLLNQLFCQDINTIEDWALAELKVKRMHEDDFSK